LVSRPAAEKSGWPVEALVKVKNRQHPQ